MSCCLSPSHSHILSRTIFHRKEQRITFTFVRVGLAHEYWVKWEMVFSNLLQIRLEIKVDSECDCKYFVILMSFWWDFSVPHCDGHVMRIIVCMCGYKSEHSACAMCMPFLVESALQYCSLFVCHTRNILPQNPRGTWIQISKNVIFQCQNE